MNTPGDRLERVREKLNLSVSGFVDKFGIGRSAYYNYRNNKRDLPGELLTKLCKYGIDTNWLLTGVGEMFRPKLEEQAGATEDQVKDRSNNYIIKKEKEVTRRLEELIDQYKQVKQENSNISVAKYHKYKELINELEKIEPDAKEDIIQSLLTIIRNRGRDE